MTVYLVILLPNIPYIHRTYTILADPTYSCAQQGTVLSLVHCNVLSWHNLFQLLKHARSHKARPKKLVCVTVCVCVWEGGEGSVCGM